MIITKNILWTLYSKRKEIQRKLQKGLLLILHGNFRVFYRKTMRNQRYFFSIIHTVNYDEWAKRMNAKQNSEVEAVRLIEQISYKPKISIIVPVYDTEETNLRRCINSVLAQWYQNWELCIADDASTKSYIREVLKEYTQLDPRIQVVYRTINGNISLASNSALELATGEYVGFLDHDDELTADALYEVIKLLNKHPDADMIYSDEDKIDQHGNAFDPFFKPDWSPDLLLGQMYTCHFTMYRTSLIRILGGFRQGFEGSQDHDMALRLSEKTTSIYHVSKVLYHWRATAGSTALNFFEKGYAMEAGRKAVAEALSRRGLAGSVEAVPDYPGCFRIHYSLGEKPLISIIIPTRDNADVLANCLQSIFTRTRYPNFEVIVVDNGSVEKKTEALLSQWQTTEPHRFFVVSLNIPFNYSRLNNFGVVQSKGELLVFLNNDIEVLTEDWLTEMAGFVTQSSNGAIGVKLLYPDLSIQHAGVVLGMGGIAGHAFKFFANTDEGYFRRLFVASNVSAVTGACLMIRRNLFESLGGFDETLAVAFNDVDLCIRVREKGFKNVLIPYVCLIHHESISRGEEDTEEKEQRFVSEINIMQTRWREKLFMDPYYNINLTLNREDYSLRDFDNE